MWLTTPEKITDVLIEFSLEPVSDDVFDWPLMIDLSVINSNLNLIPVSHDTLYQLRASGVLGTMPVVSIGQPETWKLQDLYSPSKLPRSIQTKLSKANFYVVRLSCSFRPVPGESQVKLARFRATLLPHSSTGKRPEAFDLFPRDVVQEVKRQTKVTLSPQLKFQELGASAGSAEFGFEYTELIPLVSAAIGDSYEPIWDYSAGPGQEVQGTKWMYLLVKAPKESASGQASLELDAYVQVRGFLLFWHRQEQITPQLTVSLWR